ncbi:MAG: dTDP-4-dehydrorhamnose 3,5-epimerase, partial [Magnetococcales bacterium]|nr:dTDP-4-dehydrorhamnose 3,5-epimerase [Magnetococcales bacterium]
RMEEVGESRYVRLTVPPGIWFGFQGRATHSSLLMNIADIEHDSAEVLRKVVDDFDYNWNGA